MSSLASLIVAPRHRLLSYFLLWLILFLAALGLGLGVLLVQVSEQVRRDRDAELTRIAAARDVVVTTLRKLNDEAPARGCSKALQVAMQRVAFLPDGLNKFLYAPDGVVHCSTNRTAFDPPYELGEADIRSGDANGLNLWIDRDLSYITHVARVGSIAALGDFAVVLPPRGSGGADAAWFDREVVIVAPEGRVWNVGGEEGLYRNLAGEGVQGLSKWFGLSGITCDAQSRHCVASNVYLAALGREWPAMVLLVVALAAAVAWLMTNYIVKGMKRYWSFEARFRRHFEHVVAFYQPIVDLRSGQVSGCEVLARWCDIDGTIVPPDKFLGIVEKTNRTAEFTRLIVDRAYEELSAHIPEGRRLQVNFNIFGCDLFSETLLPIFDTFDRQPKNFDAAVELLENQDVDFECAQTAILALKAAGLKVYIDDFGIGYSSIERAATLAVDGVKLDRTFAMAPANTILERLLVQILDMLTIPGRTVVVEGVETKARLNLLRETGNVDYVQGYGISRPLPIHDFVAFLEKWPGLQSHVPTTRPQASVAAGARG